MCTRVIVRVSVCNDWHWVNCVTKSANLVLVFFCCFLQLFERAMANDISFESSALLCIDLWRASLPTAKFFLVLRVYRVDSWSLLYKPSGMSGSCGQVAKRRDVWPECYLVHIFEMLHEVLRKKKFRRMYRDLAPDFLCQKKKSGTVKCRVWRVSFGQSGFKTFTFWLGWRRYWRKRKN